MILINQIFNNFYKNKNTKINLILSDYDKFFYTSCIIIIFIILNKINITTNFIYSLFISFGLIYIIYYYEINNNKNEKINFLNKYLNNKSHLYTHNSFIDFLYGLKHFDNIMMKLKLIRII